MNKCYSELIRLPTFEERLEYLRTFSKVGDITHGGHRFLSQEFYRSREWKRFRNEIIIRDHGCDLACLDRPLENYLTIHHINPLQLEALINNDFSTAFDSENVILTSDQTHLAIHYGTKNKYPSVVAERKPFDTCPWRVEY